MQPPAASAFLVAAFVALAIAVVSLALIGVAAAGRRRDSPAARVWWPIGSGLAVAVWMAATWGVAASGVLLDFERRPPPFMLMVATVFAVSGLIAFSPMGSRLVSGLPLAALIAFQGFRFPLELVMHRAATEGVMPEQMSYTGRNFDILTGLSALIVGFMIWRGVAGRRTAMVWNVTGSMLLANILAVAIASTPLFAWFGPDRLNTWVAYPPYIWLATIFVLFAITGHLLVWRKLRER